MIYAIAYFIIGLIIATLVKLARFYEINKLQLFFIWIGWPWLMFALLFFGLAGVGDDE